MSKLSAERLAEIKEANRRIEVKQMVSHYKKILLCGSVEELEEDLKTMLGVVYEYKNSLT